MKTTFLIPIALALAAATVGGGTARGAIRVYGEAASTGPDINVQVYADISDTAILSHSFKLFYPRALLRVAAATRPEAIWRLQDGASSFPYAPPDTTAAGEVLFVGACLDAAHPLAGVTGGRVPLGSVRFNRNTSDTPNFDLTIGRTGQFASFATTNGVVLEAQPGGVQIEAVGADPDDRDLDGLRDKWEEKFFGGTRGVFYSDDPDGDGLNNLSEQAVGSDPTDPRSNLQLTISSRRGLMLLEWASVDGKTYAIDLGKQPGKFEPMKEGIKATPPLNTLELDERELGDAMFFRVRLEAAATR